MKRFIAALAAGSLLVAYQAPADAHIVYFKDGTSVRGTVTLKDATLSIKGDSTEMSFPLESVRAVSFSDEPIVYEQKSATTGDWVLYSTVAANLAAVIAAVLIVAQKR